MPDFSLNMDAASSLDTGGEDAGGDLGPDPGGSPVQVVPINAGRGAQRGADPDPARYSLNEQTRRGATEGEPGEPPAPPAPRRLRPAGPARPAGAQSAPAPGEAEAPWQEAEPDIDALSYGAYGLPPPSADPAAGEIAQIRQALGQLQQSLAWQHAQGAPVARAPMGAVPAAAAPQAFDASAVTRRAMEAAGPMPEGGDHEATAAWHGRFSSALAGSLREDVGRQVGDIVRAEVTRLARPLVEESIASSAKIHAARAAADYREQVGSDFEAQVEDRLWVAMQQRGSGLSPQEVSALTRDQFHRYRDGLRRSDVERAARDPVFRKHLMAYYQEKNTLQPRLAGAGGAGRQAPAPGGAGKVRRVMNLDDPNVFAD